MTVIDEIAAERRRQIENENWTSEHDDSHDRGQMARAAAVYAYTSTLIPDEIKKHERALWGSTAGMFSVLAWLWPWSASWFKPKNPRRDLVRAGALIVAEIERLDRAEAAKAV